MNSFSIAFKMFKSNLKAYGFYLAVMIFAVAVYYDFMVLKYDPGFLKAKEVISAARTASSVTSVILVIFLFFFVWYSSSFFLKQRKKEIAIYSLMGISNRKIGCIFAIESLFTGVVSVCIGLAFGILFSRLFLMAVVKVALLEVSIGFSIPLKGLKELITVFGVIFLLLSAHSFINVARSRLIDLISDSHKEEQEPKFKAIRAVLSVLLIGAGYCIRRNISLGLLVVILVVIGTFWLFGALLPSITKLLTNNKSILYKGVRIVSISNISFRIRANYRSLAMLAVMTATTLTAFGTSLSLKYYVDETHHLDFPYSFSYVLNDKDTENRVINAINSSKHRLVISEKIEYLDVNVSMDAGMGYGKDNCPAVKYSDFLKISQDMKSQYPGKVPDIRAIKGKEVIMIISPVTVGGIFTYEGKNAAIGNKEYSIVQEMKTPLFGSGRLYHSNCLIVSDEEYKKLSTDHNKMVFNGFIVTDPKNSLELAKSILEILPKDTKPFAYVAEYMRKYQFMGLFYFLGTFMSIVFIFATGSIMYFKILSEGLADKSKYDILRKIGMTGHEIQKAVSMQVGLSLVLPLAVGIIHSLFAIDVLQKTLGYNLIVPTLATIAIYAVFYGIFYAATTRKFMKLVYQQT